jgi:hypothetical protein
MLLTNSVTLMAVYILSVWTTKLATIRSASAMLIRANSWLSSGLTGKKYTLSVMTFGPRKNAPAFYTCMMLIFRGEYDSLFKERRPNETAHKGSRTIIDDILL